MIRHRNRQSSGEPDGRLQVLNKDCSLPPLRTAAKPYSEILDIVHQSLRKKAASLDDDSWMFEPEKDIGF